MKSISKLVFSIFLSSFMFLNAQEYKLDKSLTFEDAVYLNKSIFPKRLNMLQWQQNSRNYTYTSNRNVIKKSADNATTFDTILGLEDFVPLKYNGDSLHIKRIPRFRWVDENLIEFEHLSALYQMHIESKELSLENNWPNEALDKAFSVNNDVAFTLGQNIYLSRKGILDTITSDTIYGISNGKSVHRREFGIDKGIFWSPMGGFLAFYRNDERMVLDYPLVDITTREAELKKLKYPMAGMTNEQVKLGIYNLETRQTVFIQTGDSIDQYLTNICWDPNEKYIYISILNRDQNHLKLNKYNVSDGSFVQTLLEEKSSKWVEPEYPMYFLEGDDDVFIWFSERSGWMHMHLYKTNGQPYYETALTEGEWSVNEFLGFDPVGEKVFFTATKESPIEKHVYSVNIKNRKVKKLSGDHGTHTPFFSHDYKYFIDAYSSTDLAKIYEMRSQDGEMIYEILKDKDPLLDYNLGEIILGTIENEEGTELYYRMIKPADFDSTKQYPVFLYVYGGPHSQLVTDSWMGGASIFMQLMAERGYVVFTLDNRGTKNRGFDFENTIHRNLGKKEVEDQLAGIDFLLEQDFVDPDRIVLQGWSYGGFITIYLMLTEPGLFKAGVAGGPVTDWKYYEIMYGERYMDTPENNPEGYKNASLIENAGMLEDHLLIIHGAMDQTVVMQHSLAFVQKAIEEKKQLDYFVYPKAEHNVRGIDRAHLLEKIFLYLDNHIK
jgi:dipeptidyl-peptidase-4